MRIGRRQTILIVCNLHWIDGCAVLSMGTLCPYRISMPRLQTVMQVDVRFAVIATLFAISIRNSGQAVRHIGRAGSFRATDARATSYSKNLLRVGSTGESFVAIASYIRHDGRPAQIRHDAGFALDQTIRLVQCLFFTQGDLHVKTYSHDSFRDDQSQHLAKSN